MVTTIINSDMGYSQHLLTFINIALIVQLYNIQKQSQQLFITTTSRCYIRLLKYMIN